MLFSCSTMFTLSGFGIYLGFHIERSVLRLSGGCRLFEKLHFIWSFLGYMRARILVVVSLRVC